MGLRMLTTSGDPVMRWMAGNATYKQDSEGKIKPDKIRSKAPIDGVVTLVMALGVHAGQPEQSDAGFFSFGDEILTNDIITRPWCFETR